jgi:hypothetical protein
MASLLTRAPRGFDLWQDICQVVVRQDQRTPVSDRDYREVQAHPSFEGARRNAVFVRSVCMKLILNQILRIQPGQHVATRLVSGHVQAGQVEELLYLLQKRGAGGPAPASAGKAAPPAAPAGKGAPAPAKGAAPPAAVAGKPAAPAPAGKAAPAAPAGKAAPAAAPGNGKIAATKAQSRLDAGTKWQRTALSSAGRGRMGARVVVLRGERMASPGQLIGRAMDWGPRWPESQDEGSHDGGW